MLPGLFIAITEIRIEPTEARFQVVRVADGVLLPPIQSVSGNVPLDRAEQAKVNQLNAVAITIEVSNADKTQVVRLEFPTPASGVLSLKRRLGILVAESRAQLG
ncbi:MAG: hypothetical protein AAGG51_10680 [Cyanobacteria bacterium P01_G01_bin.54]